MTPNTTSARRKNVSELPQDVFGTACPVSGVVPAILADDPLFHELCDAFDELLSPMASALDCFAAYLDPWLAPPDFLDWLDEVVGAGAEPSWPVERRRTHVAEAVSSHKFRGTAEGLRREAAVAAGVLPGQVTVEDPGGVTYSSRPLPPSPGKPDGPQDAPVVVVRVRLPADPTTDWRPDRAANVSALVQDAVESVRPVHCQVRTVIEEVTG
jgi:phage tail-like protein